MIIPLVLDEPVTYRDCAPFSRAARLRQQVQLAVNNMQRDAEGSASGVNTSRKSFPTKDSENWPSSCKW